MKLGILGQFGRRRMAMYFLSTTLCHAGLTYHF